MYQTTWITKLCFIYPPPCDWVPQASVFSSGGGAGLIKDVRRGRGVKLKQKNADKGREGVQNPENFADVLYEWSLITPEGCLWTKLRRPPDKIILPLSRIMCPSGSKFSIAPLARVC